MYSRLILGDIMRLERAMGPSHECHRWGSVFLAHSDGCPNCGNYRISSLHKTEEKQEDWDMETYPVIVINFDNPDSFSHIVNIGDFSPYPRAWNGNNARRESD